MIGYLKGVIIEVDSESLILEVNGVGYLIFTDTGALQIGENREFYIYSHVREDQFNLFGFLTKKELILFKLLISVKGVGPKVGMVILSNISADELVRAIIEEDYNVIQSVPGVGKKGSERIVLENKNKLEGLGYKSESKDRLRNTIIDIKLRREVLGALQNLGYNRDEAEERIDSVDISSVKELTVESLIKLCLSS